MLSPTEINRNEKAMDERRRFRITGKLTVAKEAVMARKGSSIFDSFDRSAAPREAFAWRLLVQRFSLQWHLDLGR